MWYNVRVGGTGLRSALEATLASPSFTRTRGNVQEEAIGQAHINRERT